MTLGVQNRTHDLVIMLKSDADMETLLDILNQPHTELIDVEGVQRFVVPLNFSIEQLGGEPGIYTATVSFIEDVANEQLPPPPLPGITLEITFQVLDSTMTPIPNAQVTIGSTTLFTNSSGYAGPFAVTVTAVGVTLTLTVEYVGGAVIPNAQVILQQVRKVTNTLGQVVYNISANGIVS